MIKLQALTAILLIPAFCAVAQPPDTLWTQSYGGAQGETCYDGYLTSDGGFIMIGSTTSFGAGNQDIYLVKTDDAGDTIWTKTYGGESLDLGRSVQQTSDGGYILCGETYSFGAGNSDAYIIKTNADGDTIWTRTYGNASMDNCRYIRETNDDGYIMVGDNDYSGALGRQLYLLKIDSQGDSLWMKMFGGASIQYGRCVQNALDGGYIVCGESREISPMNDIYVIRTDANGDTLWIRTFQEDNIQNARYVIPTADGGFAVTGNTGFMTNFSIYLKKISADGDESWTENYGLNSFNDANCVRQTSDGGFIISGSTETSANGDDFWIIKTDGGGIVEWNTTIGGGEDDSGFTISQTLDNGYYAAGYTLSSGAGMDDIYLAKLEGTTPVGITLNPTSIPLQIPAGGGNFTFTVNIINLTNNTQNFDAWTMVEFPNGILYGPILLRPDMQLGGQGSLSRTITQNVPASIPPGYYIYYAFIGDYPDTIMTSDFFTFEKME